MQLTATDGVSSDVSVSAGNLRRGCSLSDLGGAESESDDGGELRKSHWSTAEMRLVREKTGVS